jgi:hypothetical protein
MPRPHHAERFLDCCDVKRIVIHAGFGKCGNASIRAALFQNFRKLQKHNVLIFDKDLRIARSAADLVGTPIWSVERARKKSENLTQDSAAVRPSRRKTDYVAILSAENLSIREWLSYSRGSESV